MENKKTKLLAILCILLSIGCISTAFAYYNAATVSVKNTFIAAGGGKFFDFDTEDTTKKGVFTLDETEYALNEKGEYAIQKNADGSIKKTTANNYKVMPGVIIPKDPTITIKNKSEIPAYLFIEVVGDCSDYFTYELDAIWKEVEGATGLHDGTVYVYQSGGEGTTGTILGSVASNTYNIIKNQQLKANNDITVTSEQTLEFYAYLAQTGIGSLAETYNACFPKQTPQSQNG